MNATEDNLERLFSRYIDGECTPDECEHLESLVSHDAKIRASFEDYQQLDAQFGAALREAAGRESSVCHCSRAVSRARIHPYWSRLGRGLALAAAACLALITWHKALRPTGQIPASGQKPLQASAASWFAPQPAAADVVQPVPSAYNRPELRVRGTQRDWIVIPGDQPGEYLVIEVDRVRTHVIGVHQDF